MNDAIQIGLRRLNQLFLIKTLRHTPELAASVHIAANEPLATKTNILKEGRRVIWEQLMTRRLLFERSQLDDVELVMWWG